MRFVHCGCKVNMYETNAMMQIFLNNGYEIVEFTDIANIYVVNTCTVTNMADKKSRQMLRKVKSINPNSILVAVGCYAQVAKDELSKIPEIDLILGVNEKKDILEHIEKYKQNNIEISDVLHKKEFAEFGSITYSEKTRAVIKVQDGCDRYCTYCIIPYARGRVRSRKPENVLNEIKDIAKKGIKEVVITGIHVASYGKDFKEEYKLIDLLEEINNISGLDRIRLGSLEPTLITKEFVDRLIKLDKICNHFHLSLQSGCDETLKRMNRRYTTEEFSKSVEILRKAYPEVSLTTDIIVGFPGETEEEFNTTYKFLENIKFYKMHVFQYSPRKGTKAEVMPNQIDGKIKESRSKKLIELSNKNEIMYNEKYIGRKIDVLFEDEHIEDGIKYIKGHTKNYMVVKVKLENGTKEEYSNLIKKVNVIGTDKMELIAEFC